MTVQFDLRGRRTEASKHTAPKLQQPCCNQKTPPHCLYRRSMCPQRTRAILPFPMPRTATMHFGLILAPIKNHFLRTLVAPPTTCATWVTDKKAQNDIEAPCGIEKRLFDQLRKGQSNLALVCPVAKIS